jgi:hypothetical protein
MPSLNQELVEILNQLVSDIASRVARRIGRDKRQFSLYANLTEEQIALRIALATHSVIASIEINDAKPLMDFLDKVFEARLRAGYDPNVLLRVVELTAEQIVEAAAWAHPEDQPRIDYLSRKIALFNTSAKLHLVNFNLAIPVEERIMLDPDLFGNLSANANRAE